MSIARSGETMAPIGAVELAYETFGEPTDPPLLMIMGLGAQMIYWPEELCEMLVERELWVIRFDNRDSGRSTIFDAAGTPSLLQVLAGNTSGAAYSLDEMAEDACGLLDHLGIAAAHVVGASLGGMIAQTLAVNHPGRVLSLASIMSSTGDRVVGQPHPEAIPALMTRPPRDREGFVETVSKARAAIGSPGFPRDMDRTRRLAERAFDRGFHPEGTLRQLVAIMASGNRTEALRGLDVPTVVIHGDSDPLIDVSGGRATAAAIPGAELIIVPGMGHDLPKGVWRTVADAVVGNIERATSA